MKKIVLFVLLTAAAGGILLAQTNTPAPAAIKGTLGLSSGRIAVKSGGLTYYVRGLERFIGFIDGLKDGAQVSLEGYASAPSVEGHTERLFYPVKLTLNGKDYEVGSAQAASGGWDRPLGGGRMDRTGPRGMRR
jgi:hypothetical protein